ncbi:hypothetical protein OG599_28555 [Streptomyces sp. NBC_01335]|uniref:hypothetical protein n=1 Tax=Streptomyces sp. NBC_01335 TaxID=2903828 RepID=UPI002E152D5E|nr:hypothetical protein OG599_28555 [Streptomyces sp. NBC_01335]
MAVRKTATTLLAAATLVAGSLLGLMGPASASARPDEAALAAKALAGARQHAVESPAVVKSAAAALSCSYTYVCGQGSNGNSFAYTKCNTLYQLPNLTGSGPLINNQTPGTVAYFYDKNQSYLFSSTAYQSTTVNWTPVWYAIAC